MASQFPFPILLELCAVGPKQEIWEENVYTSDQVRVRFYSLTNQHSGGPAGQPRRHTFMFRAMVLQSIYWD